MADDELREAERVWLAERSEEAAARLLQARLRVGQGLSQEQMIDLAVRLERLWLCCGRGGVNGPSSGFSGLARSLGVPVTARDRVDYLIRQDAKSAAHVHRFGPWHVILGEGRLPPGPDVDMDWARECACGEGAERARARAIVATGEPHEHWPVDYPNPWDRSYHCRMPNCAFTVDEVDVAQALRHGAGRPESFAALRLLIWRHPAAP